MCKIGIISSHELALKLIASTEVSNDFLCGSVGIILGEGHLSPGPESLMQSLLAELWPDLAYHGRVMRFMQLCDPWESLPETSLELRIAFLSRILARPDRQLCWLRSEK